MVRTDLLSLAIGLGCLSVIGCSGLSWDHLPKTVPANGRLTLEGKPLSGVKVLLIPTVSGNGKVGASAKTNDDGSFTLSTNDEGDGAVPGEYRIVLVVESDEEEPTEEELKQLQQLRTKIPAKCMDPSQTDLKISVSEGKSELGTIDLKR